MKRRDFIKLMAIASPLIISAPGCLGTRPFLGNSNPMDGNPRYFTSDLPTGNNEDCPNIHYNVVGYGDTNIIYVHGFMGDRTSWKKVIPFLEVYPDYRQIAIDMPGWGSSDKPKSRYNMEYYVENLECFMEAMNIQKSFLVGQSYGATVVRKYAAVYPGKVEGLVICSGYGEHAKLNEPFGTFLFRNLITRKQAIWLFRSLGSFSQFASGFRRNVFEKDVITDEEVKRVYLSAQHGDYFNAMINTLINLDLGLTEEENEAIRKIPIVYLAGAEDRLIQVTHPKRLERKLILLNETAHILNSEAPEAIATVVRSITTGNPPLEKLIENQHLYFDSSLTSREKEQN